MGRVVIATRAGLVGLVLLFVPVARAQYTAVPRTTELAVQEQGLCVQAVFDPSRVYLSTVDEADGMLRHLPVGALEALSRVRVPDLTNGTERAHGDYPEDLPMPFSAEGTPSGPGERIAMRLWGELRVERAGWYTLGIRTDDGYRLIVGGEVVREHVRVRVPLIDTVSVFFPSPGLYPVELVYFENLIDALIELSVLEAQVDEVTDAESFPSPGFALIPTSMLAIPPEGCVPRGREAADAGLGDAGPRAGLVLHGNGLCSAAHGPAPMAPLALVLFALTIALARKRSAAALAMLALLALSTPTRVEAQRVASLDRFVPSAGVLGAPTVSGAPDERGISASVLLDHARSPLARTDAAGERVDIVRSQTVLHVALEVPVLPELRLSVVVPGTLDVEGQRDPDSGAAPGGPGLGDLQLGARARVITIAAELVLAGSAYLDVPTPAASAWTASTEVGAHGELSLTLQLAPVRAVLSAGARMRSGQPLVNLRPGPEGVVGLAVQVAVVPELSLGLELLAATSLEPARFGADDSNAGELGLFGRLALGVGLRALLAGSIGLGRAYGVPEARVVVGVGWDLVLDASPEPREPQQEAAQ